MNIRITFSLLFLLACFHPIFAQNAQIEVTGKVVERNSQQALEFATIQLINANTQQLIAGTATDLDGTFSLQTEVRDFQIEVGFIGFQTQRITDFEIEKGKVRLGTISLSEDAAQLDEVVVRAEKSQTEFKLDKRVFNVGQDLSSTGASALEVLSNVPSVNVNIEGQISLRGSTGVQVLINGKPSVMASEGGNALSTITADMIEKVEVITNPSAKYDAEGTSGIINIVLKKEEKKGVNGSVSLNTGIPHNHSLGLSLNRRTEKFNLFSQIGAGYRELPRYKESINRNLTTNTSILSEGTEYRNEIFYNLILGTDYYINPSNVITLSAFVAYEIEDQPSNFDFSEVDATGATLTKWSRSEVTEATNPKLQYEFQYKKDFEDHKEHDFLFSAIGNFFGKEQSSEFANTSTLGLFEQGDQRTRTAFQEGGYTFKTDYTKPLSEKMTLETGAQYVIQDVSNDFSVSDFTDGAWLVNTALTNIFEYDQKVLGAYVTTAYEDERWGLKVGVRAENTDLNTLLTNTNEGGNQNYTNIFPTFHTSYKITDQVSLQAGYSKRIFRPRLWDLNPFFNIRNNFNIRTGNPNLLPEFTDSYEVMSIYILEAVSFNFGVYYRNTTDVVERIFELQDNVSISRPENIGTNRETGMEFNAKYSPNKWLTLNGDFNFSYFNREGEWQAQSFDFQANRWNTRLNAKFKLPQDLDVELTGNYRSAFQTVQGQQSDMLFAGLGLRKKIFQRKAVISFSVRDLFASRIRETETFQPDFYLYNYGLRGRFITLGFSYGFGKGEAMEFSGGRRRF